jgi:hypothetical protein
MSATQSGKSQSSASEQQIDDKHDQQNTADTDPATISPPAIPETAAEEEYQYYNNKDQVHSFSPLRFPLSRFGVAPQIVHHTVPESAEPVERLIGQCLAVERDSEFHPLCARIT